MKYVSIQTIWDLAAKFSEINISSFFRAEVYIDEENNVAKCISGHNTPLPIKMFMFILNLGYLFRFVCLGSKATRIEDYMGDTAKSGDAAVPSLYQESSATAAVAGATVDSQTKGKIFYFYQIT